MISKRKVISTIIAITILVATVPQEVLFASEKKLKSLKYSTGTKQMLNSKYKVRVAKATVRNSPTNSSSRVGNLKKGNIVTVYEIINGWGNINYNGNNAYVKMSDLQLQNDEPIKFIPQKGIFSWNYLQCLEGKRAETLYWIDKLELNEFYQCNLFEMSPTQLSNFVKELKVSRNVDVYDLVGDPSWYNKPEILIKYMDRIKDYNDTVEKESKIKGIVFDVEPWVLGDGQWSQEVYANTVRLAYEHAQAIDIEMVMVIPFWLQTSSSEVIIQNSDKVIVMNYNITDPVNFIKEEIQLASKYGKKISSAAETKKIDTIYGVEKNTTYYYVGVEKLKKDWQNIYTTYGYDKLEYSLHDFNSVKEFIK